MNVAIGSMFRDSNKHGRIWERLMPYYELGFALRQDGHNLTCVFVENDSKDDTYYQLNEFGGCGHVDSILVRKTDDCPYWGSVDHPDRWRHLAWVANGVFEELDGSEDAVIYVESDLIWEPATMLRLLEHLETVDAVAPCNMHRGAWYDTWGSRIGGVRFQAQPPYHPALVGAEGLVPVESTAGCTAMRGEVAKQVRFQPEDCYVGLCRDVRSHGYGLWLDPSLTVEHP